MRRMPATLVALAACGTLVLGCGEGGVSEGATVSVYVAPPLCAEAERELKKKGAEAGEVEVRAICLPAVETGDRADLAATGANARRATEDSTSVAFLEAPGPAARFSQSVVEAAGIAWVETDSGAGVMRQVLSALGETDSSPRDAVRDALEG
ncbi:MAG TPA: hypothetical protein VK480_03645 [Solirubrobacterales bacterium]|nr:hypothetical protein [Solirubrobacterales bacterium]